MAIVRAVKSGNWSDTTVWNTGALPTSADDVYSNTFTVTIDVSPTVLSIRSSSTTGVTAGGKFVINTSGIVLNSNVLGQNTSSTPVVYCLEVSLTSGQSVAINGNITAGGGGNTNGMVLLTVGSVTITGACAGTSGGLGVYNNSSGTINIIGSCTSGSSGGTVGICSGAYNAANGTINITGNCNGNTTTPATSSSAGVHNASTGTVNVTGDCIGGNSGNAFGVRNASTGALSITGNLTPGSVSLCPGVYNDSSGPVSVIGSIQSTNISPGLIAVTSGAIVSLSGPFLTSSNGFGPVYAYRWFWLNTSPPSTYYQIRSANLSVIRPLYTADSVGGNPAVTNVRSGTVYGPASELTGTCAVPAAGSVAFGVPVDNTTGTATLTAANVRAAVGLASANLDTQLAAIPTTAAPSASTIATAVWAAATSALTTAGTIGKLLADNINATISSAAADSSGVTTLLSRLTSGRASALDNLDASVGSRLAGASYQAPLDAAGTRSAVGLATNNLDTQLSGITSGISGLPNASAIASAVWAAATRTLTTAIDNSSTIAAAVWSYATGRTITGGTVDTLTNAPSVPSASTIASQVRTELATELARIDVATSTRLAPSGTLARVTLTDTATTLTNAPTVPSTAQIATQVRTELTPELARVANCATTQEVDDIVEGALS